MNEKKTNSVNEHPSDEDLAALAEGHVSDWTRQNILAHVEKCEKCSFILTEVASFQNDIPSLGIKSGELKPLSIGVVQAKIDSPEDGRKSKKVRPWRHPGDTFYFWIAAAIFILSFLIEEYRMHMFIATVFFGLLAAIDYSHRNIFAPLIRAWREGDDTKADEAIEDLRDRFKIS